MSAIDNTPTNKNFLSQLEFRFLLKRAPHVNFFVQRVNIPKIVLNEWIQPSGLVNIPIHGEHIDYAPLVVEFKVDEDFKNYLEISDWITGLGTPDNLSQFSALKNQPKYTGESINSDISLIILNSVKKINYDIVFKDAFPTSISDLVFTTTPSDIDYLEALATFSYTSYTITKF